MKSNKPYIVAVVLIIVGLLVGYALYAIINSQSDQAATFTDELGTEQTIGSFQECMDWAMPWEQDGDEVVCTAPGDVTFTADCSAVPEVECTSE